MPFVAQTIESVLAQAYGHLEYIMIDGGSCDGTLDVIKARQAKISRWVSEPDDGIADAFNKGLALSSGDYVLFLNADDALAADDVIEIVSKEIVSNGFPSIIYGDCDYVDRDTGNVLRRLRVRMSPVGLLRGKMPPHPGMFAHRRYFEKYGNFDPAFRIAMDFEWFLRGARNERIIHVPLVITRMRAGGISTHNRSYVVDEIIGALRKNGYLSTRWQILAVRAYFLARLFLRNLIEKLQVFKRLSAPGR